MSSGPERIRGRGVVGAILLASTCACPVAGQTFTAAGISISFSGDGKVSSLLDTVAGCERVSGILPANRPYACRVQYAGTLHDPTSFASVGSQLIYTFGTIPTSPTVVVGVTVRPTYLVFSVDSVSNTSGIEFIRFLGFSTLNSRTGRLFRFLTYTDCNAARRLGVYPLDFFTRTDVGAAGAGGFVLAEAVAGLPWPDFVPMVGRKVALFTCEDSQEGVFAACSVIESDYGIPLGVAVKQEPLLKRSQLFWMDFLYADAADVLAYTLQCGYGKILLNAAQWADTFNSYRVRTIKWGSQENLANWIDACHAAGIVVGAHMLPSKIRRDSVTYIRDGASPILRRLYTATLAADVPADQVSGLIQTTTPPIGWPDAYEKRDIVINGEIIAFQRLKTDAPPYGFEGPFVRARNQADGLGPQFHAAGSTVGALSVTDDRWGYELDLGNGGMATYMADIAATVDAVGFDFLYLDGLDYKLTPPWYWVSAQQRVAYDALSNPPLWMEAAANAGTHSWPLLSVDGQIDYTFIETNGLKSEVNRDLDRKFSTTQQALTEFTQLQIGWIELSNPSAAHTTVDEIEYALAKSVAYDMPLSVQVWISSLRNWPHRDANLWLMRQYEELRLSGYFPEEVKLAARKRDKDFMLFRDGQGGWLLEPVSEFSPGGSTLLRGYIADNRVNGVSHATLWPAAADGAALVTLGGLLSGAVEVEDYEGNAVPLEALGGGLFRFPVNTRVYVRLANLPDPVVVFTEALVTDSKELSPGP